MGESIDGTEKIREKKLLKKEGVSGSGILERGRDHNVRFIVREITGRGERGRFIEEVAGRALKKNP